MQAAQAEAAVVPDATHFVVVPETTLTIGKKTHVEPAFRVSTHYASVVGGRAVISPTEKPRVNISYRESRKAAAAAGYGVLTETQAVVIAHLVASVGENWASGKVGEGELRRGLRKGSVRGVQRNDYEPRDPAERRTFILPDGKILLDVAGHIYGRTFDNVQGDEEGIVARPFAADSLSIALAPFPSMQRGAGWYPSAGSNWSGGALFRGGCWYSRDRAGVFLLCYGVPHCGGGDVGFRCTLPIQDSGTGLPVAA